MSDFTLDQANQAKDHLVTIEFVYPLLDGGVSTAEGKVTGIVEEVLETEPGHFQIGVVSGYRASTYDAGDDPGGYEGIFLLDEEIIAFTDHGDRSDALLEIRRMVAQRDHALQALKDAEANLARAYQAVTNLAAQEG